jgi:hypothetical protein
MSATQIHKPSGPALQQGVTYAQAMEVFARFFERLQAAPTVAQQMGIDLKVVARILNGHVWPGAYAFWSGEDRHD